MAWTAPRTWANGLVVTATILNTEIRDNLLVLDQHDHNGGSGEGNDFLADVDSITFEDVVSDPSTPGSGHTRIYSKSGNLWQKNDAGTAEEFSIETHTHEVADDVAGAESSTSSSGESTSIGLTDVTVQPDEVKDLSTPSTWHNMAQRSVTFDSNARAYASAIVLATFQVSGGSSPGTLSCRLAIEGVTAEQFVDSSPTDNEEYIEFLSGNRDLTGGSSDFAVEFTHTGTDGSDEFQYWVRMHSGSMVYS